MFFVFHMRLRFRDAKTGDLAWGAGVWKPRWTLIGLPGVGVHTSCMRVPDAAATHALAWGTTGWGCASGPRRAAPHDGTDNDDGVK